MNRLVSRLARTGALLLIAAPFLAAADQGPDVSFKVRSGFNVSDGPRPNDNLQTMALGFGVNVGWHLGPGKLNTELGYFYKPGRQYLDDIRAPGVTLVHDDDGNVIGGSVDSRKNSLTSVNLRLSWEAPINDTWSWQLGVMAGSARFRHEYFADVSTEGYAVEDTYNGTPTKSQFSASPFIGLSYKVSEASSLELNVISVSYKSINFVHTPGSALVSGDPNRPGSNLVYAGDHLDTSTRNSVHIEIGYVFHF